MSIPCQRKAVVNGNYEPTEEEGTWVEPGEDDEDDEEDEEKGEDKKEDETKKENDTEASKTENAKTEADQEEEEGMESLRNFIMFAWKKDLLKCLK